MVKHGSLLALLIAWLFASMHANAAEVSGNFKAVIAVVTHYRGVFDPEPTLAGAISRVERSMRSYARWAGYPEDRTEIVVVTDASVDKSSNVSVQAATRIVRGGRHDQIIDAVYQAALNTSAKDDSLVFFFSGHGNQLGDKEVILHTSGSDGSAPTNRIRLKNEIIDDAFARSKAAIRLVLIDACQTVRPGRSFTTPTPLAAQATLESLRSQGIAIITASEGDQVAWVSPTLGYGFFTERLSESLESGKYRTAETLTKFVHDAVSNDVKKQFPGMHRDQRPIYLAPPSAGGPFYLSLAMRDRVGGQVINGVVRNIVLSGMPFEKAEMTPDHKKELDDFLSSIKGVTIRAIKLTGHESRGSAVPYAQKLTERRAMLVRDYLVSKGIASSLMVTEGKGIREPLPVTGLCSITGSTAGAFIECTAPDRRVVVEVVTDR